MTIFKTNEFTYTKKYLWDNYKNQVISWLLFLIFICISSLNSISWFNLKLKTTIWNDMLSPALTIFSLFTPAILGLLIVHKEWKDSLEKRLIVHFTARDESEKKRYVMSGYNIYLPPNSGIRELGQQVGAQISGSRFLQFDPSIVENSKGIEYVKDENGKKIAIYYYELEFLLSDNQTDKEIKALLISNEYKVKFFCNENQYNLSNAISFSPFHKNPLTLNKLLCDDKETIKEIEPLVVTIEPKYSLYFLNSAVLELAGIYSYVTTNPDTAKEIISLSTKYKLPIISAIAYPITAEKLGKLLNNKIDVSTKEVKFQFGDKAIVYRPKNRKAKISEASPETLEVIEWELGILERIG